MRYRTHEEISSLGLSRTLTICIWGSLYCSTEFNISSLVPVIIETLNIFDTLYWLHFPGTNNQHQSRADTSARHGWVKYSGGILIETSTEWNNRYLCRYYKFQHHDNSSFENMFFILALLFSLMNITLRDSWCYNEFFLFSFFLSFHSSSMLFPSSSSSFLLLSLFFRTYSNSSSLSSPASSSSSSPPPQPFLLIVIASSIIVPAGELSWLTRPLFWSLLVQRSLKFSVDSVVISEYALQRTFCRIRHTVDSAAELAVQKTVL